MHRTNTASVVHPCRAEQTMPLPTGGTTPLVIPPGNAAPSYALLTEGETDLVQTAHAAHSGTELQLGQVNQFDLRGDQLNV